MRVQISALPDKPTKCNMVSCVYNDNNVCDDPRINKANGDAECHKMNNKDLLLILKETN